MTTLTDLLGSAIEKKPVDFAAQFNELVAQRAAQAVADRKIELAQSIYATDADNAEPEEDELDIDDIDMDDLDIDADLDDLNLDQEDDVDDEDA
jgi:hypothetical protein